jgi:metal-sulfur cluster biosynthetic enzyme
MLPAVSMTTMAQRARQIIDFQRSPCHVEPFDYAQGMLRETSLRKSVSHKELRSFIGNPMFEQTTITEDDIWRALRDVPDPEIPVSSLVDLGVILRIELDEVARHVRVLLLPTFTGCPAIAIMCDLIRERLAQLDLSVQVDITRK